ncbi:hypothetical protein [Pantoea sp. C2G6]|uniref:hypothetical protein n=1 Tax=Pantoea sp. C2G6 TaxID=3243084 RepID=UPI003ED9BE1C
MGWSLPEVPDKEHTQTWSPWICLLIIILDLFIGVVVALLKSPTSGAPSLSSGYWLPLTIQTLVGIWAVIAIYSFWWEVQATWTWNWNEWCRTMRVIWRRRAQQHLVISRHVLISADPGLLPRLAHAGEEEGDETPALTLLPGEPLTPGITRFEQLSRYLISQIKPTLLARCPAGRLQVVIQTSSTDKDRESHSFDRVWAAESLPWKAEVQFQTKGLPFRDWNRVVDSSKQPILVLAMHYRQPDDVLPEFASALLLMPSILLEPGEQKNALRLYRAMPLNTRALTSELGELRDMTPQPAGKKHLVWHSGLSDAPRQSMNRVLNELSLSLYDAIGTGGVIDYDKACARYGDVAGWALIAAATGMAAYGPDSQWLLLEDANEAWAVMLANSAPVPERHYSAIPPPFPGGSIMVALLLNVGLYGLIIQFFPALALSWSGILLLLLSLAVTLSGIAFALRRIIARLQRPSFIKAARHSGKE